MLSTARPQEGGWPRPGAFPGSNSAGCERSVQVNMAKRASSQIASSISPVPCLLLAAFSVALCLRATCTAAALTWT